MKQKTIPEWLNELPELIRGEAIREYENSGKRTYPTDNTLSSAIKCAFTWAFTQYGDFWYSLYCDALYHEQNNLKLPR